MGDRRPVRDVQPFAELYRSATTIVYKGYQESLDRFVLLKRLRNEASVDERVVQRFQDEARLIARVQHPNVVAIHAYGEDEISAYLIAEYIEGPDLATLLEQGPMPVELAVYVLREAARGLGAAHDRGIVHRDVKPANILISIEGQVKVSDFGMASFVLDDVEDSGEVRGTMPYLAPEQVRGMAPTPATDLFSLGATFFEMLIGRRAFLGQGASDIFEAILHYDPIPALAARTNIPAEIVALCGKMLTRDPADRYASWKEVEAESTAFLERLDRRVRPANLAAYVADPHSYDRVPPLTLEEASEAPAEDVAAPEPSEREETLARRSVVIPVVLVLLVAMGALLIWRGPSVLDASRAGATSEAERLANDTRYPLQLYPYNDSLGEEEQVVAPQETQQPRSRILDRQAQSEASGSGWLRFDVDPWAVVVADNDTLGRTPLAFPVLRNAGTYRLVFLHPDFPTHQREVEVKAGETTEISVSMYDLVGRVNLEVSPWAAVWIDGVARDTIPPQSRPFILAPGEHRVRLDHPVLGEYQSVFRVEAGEVRTLRFNLYELLPD